MLRVDLKPLLPSMELDHELKLPPAEFKRLQGSGGAVRPSRCLPMFLFVIPQMVVYTSK